MFGKVVDKKMNLYQSGKIAEHFLKTIPDKYKEIRIFEFIVMPNHVHAVLEIVPTDKLQDNSKPISDIKYRRKMLLSKVIGWYKMNTAKEINKNRGTSGKSLWQRSYYDHIIRNYESYQKIYEYILINPELWRKDKFYVSENKK